MMRNFAVAALLLLASCGSNEDVLVNPKLNATPGIGLDEADASNTENEDIIAHTDAAVVTTTTSSRGSIPYDRTLTGEESDAPAGYGNDGGAQEEAGLAREESSDAELCEAGDDEACSRL
jgi:hypothetical protein